VSLLDDLKAGEAAAAGARPCPLCDLIRSSTGELEAALRATAGGTMGTAKLASILRANETGIGRRTVIRHRSEEHTP
jgi:hypothetical protein